MATQHTRAVILSTGDEILTGQLQDTNARWLSEQLVAAGIMPVAHACVGDELGDLTAAIRDAAAKAPLVIMSGGLGPTDGDLTRPALSAILGEELILDAEARAELSAKFTRRGRELTARQERQAFRPASARCLPNGYGTAPGLSATVPSAAAHGRTDVFCLPGPPGELRPMFEASVRSLLNPPPGRAVLTRLLHVVGIAEADCVTRLGELTRRDRVPLVGVTASGGILTIRIRLDGDVTGGTGAAAVERTAAEVRASLGDHVFGEGASAPADELLAQTLIAELRERSQTIAVVESCTGGMLGELLTSGSGASAAFLGGFITYSNDLKTAMGVSGATLATHGAVSTPVAREMAVAGLARSGARRCLAITGIAGPDGGSESKPVGTVHIGLASAGAEPDVRHFVFSGNRADIRQRSAVTAMAMLWFALSGRERGTPRLLWQAG